MGSLLLGQLLGDAFFQNLAHGEGDNHDVLRSEAGSHGTAFVPWVRETSNWKSPRQKGAAVATSCQERGLELFVLPPPSPKLNGHVERAKRTHTEELYQITPTRPSATSPPPSSSPDPNPKEGSPCVTNLRDEYTLLTSRAFVSRLGLATAPPRGLAQYRAAGRRRPSQPYS